MYQEYGQHHFWLDGYEGTVIEPKHPRGDGAYIWRMEFLGAFDYADRELLNRGWHLVYYKVSDQFGAPSVCGELCCGISGKSLETIFGCAGIGCFQLAGRIRPW